MQRTSDSIGALAAALARAQTELENPEKSLVATIWEDGKHGREQTFRYAPLSSGLEIVRKVLGQHEIAVVQTTSTDPAAGMINLNTMLVHASGEWIASEWPVCSVGETASPRRMGTALTYARRYALFALVGIAGEDDLDAPDLHKPMSDMGSDATKGPARQINGGSLRADKSREPPRRPEQQRTAGANQVLGLHASATLRERLIAELANIGSQEEAAIWATRNLPTKNRLRPSDAAHVEARFAAQLTKITTAPDQVPAEAGNSISTNPGIHAAEASERAGVSAIDKSALSLPEPRRLRDRNHVRSVAKRPCLVCGREPSDPHHLRFAQSRALSRKVSDEFTVPLCRLHHRELHGCGNEAEWWRRQGIDALSVAQLLWRESNPLATRNDRQPGPTHGV
jgi:hypothetical protein